MTHQTQRDHDKDQELDPASAHGGDTRPSSYVGDGPQAEEGDQRRHNPVHSGPTRPHTANKSRDEKRSGSDSNTSQ